MSSPIKGIILMLVAAALFACMDTISKFLVGIYAIPQILFIRFIVFTLFALVLVAPKGLRNAMSSKQPKLQILRSIIIVVEHSVFILAFSHLPLADTHAIAGIAPILVTLLAVFFLGERVGKRRWLAVVAGFSGLLIILRPGISAFDPAAIIPIIGAVLWAVYQILVRKVSADNASTSVIYMALIGLIFSGLFAPLDWVRPDLIGWLLLILLGLMASCAHFLLIKAFQFAPAAILQPFHYTILVWAVVFGYLVFGDFPDVWTFVGGAIIIGSGIYVFYRERYRLT